jgi:hypothetical protein
MASVAVADLSANNLKITINTECDKAMTENSATLTVSDLTTNGHSVSFSDKQKTQEVTVKLERAHETEANFQLARIVFKVLLVHMAACDIGFVFLSGLVVFHG